LGRAAALKTAKALYQAHRIHRFYDCFAAERGQARSPQDITRLKVVVNRHTALAIALTLT
jgi:hypothetical protein